MLKKLSLAGSIYASIILMLFLFLNFWISSSTEPLLFSLGITSDNSKQYLLPHVSIENLPYKIGNWNGKDLPGLGAHEEQTLQLDSFVRRLYTNSQGQQIILYIGYWRKQSGEYQAAKHSPVTCLPANGWKLFNPRKIHLQDKNINIYANELTASYNRDNSIFTYWFFQGEDTFPEEWKALYKIFLGHILHKRLDGGIVEISARLPDVNGGLEKTQTAIKNFALNLVPTLQKELQTEAPRTIPQ